MKDIIISIAILAALLTLALYSCLVVSGRESRREEEERRDSDELETGIEGRTPGV